MLNKNVHDKLALVTQCYDITVKLHLTPMDVTS